MEKELVDVLRRTLERDPARRPSIPQLRAHRWLVPVRYGLDAFNVLVLVSKVTRAATTRRLGLEDSDRAMRAKRT